MEFVVNGTKGGFRTLYSTPSAPSIGSDIRNNVSSEDAVGKSLYALAFSANGCAFTKYFIVRDTLRSYSTGTIAFSLFLPFNKELANKGADVKSLLDKISLYYSDNYIIDNNINRGETIIIQEDWSFVDDILHEYREQDKTTKEEELQSGSEDAAVIYYKNDVELLEYLDKPYQEEYSSYRQILFIDSDLRGKSIDPINVLRSSGDELNNIDLKNEKYYLINCPSKNFTITANGKPRSDRTNNNYIRAKWQVEIRYSKDDLCFEPIKARGTLSDSASEIFQFLEIRDKNIHIKHEAFNNLRPKTKAILIKVKTIKGDPVTDSIITYKHNDFSPEQTTTSNTITFIGEQIKERWFVSARKENESLMSEFIPIFPENQSEVELILRKQKVIKIFAIDKDSREPIYNFKLLMNDGQGNRENITELIFRDTDIEKTWRIEIYKKIGRDNYSGKREYCPFNGEDPLYIELQKTTWQFPQHKTYMINAGMYGKKSYYCPEYSNSSNGNDLAKNCIIPNKGYFFTYWELNDESKTLIAQYDREKSFFHNKPLLTLIIGGIIFIGFGIWILLTILEPDKITHYGSIDRDQILNYVEGDTLSLSILEGYRTDWERQKPSVSKKSSGIFTLFSGNASHTDSNEYYQWENVLNRIRNAIAIRKYINQKNFSKLKNLQNSDLPINFKKSIEKIDSVRYIEIGNRLNDVSTFTLNQIADSINSILASFETLNEPQIEHTDKHKSDRKEKSEGSKLTEHEKSSKSQQKENTAPAVQQIIYTDKIHEIINYITGDELNKQKLDEFKKFKNLPEDITKSIQLCLDFWELDGSGTGKKAKTYYSFREIIKNDKYLNNSHLKAFLDKIYTKKDASYSQIDKSKGLKKS